MALEPLRPGMNPREHLGRHRERGHVDFGYHLAELAEATGLQVSTIAAHAPLIRAARARDVATVARTVVTYLADGAGPITGAEAWPDRLDWQGQWAERWPRFEAYRCIAQVRAGPCGRIGLGGPWCLGHGGQIGFMDSIDRHVCVRWGAALAPLHRVLLHFPRGRHVHHIDFNPWNNRPANLEALTAEDHREKHAGCPAWRPITARCGEAA